MKNKLAYLLFLLPVLIAGCSKPAPIAPVFNAPLGAFTGQFVRLYKNTWRGGYDTLKANLQLDLSTNIGYTVKGDTTTIHAGSYGSFVVGTANITFFDQTSFGAGPTKTHLSGTYQYSYDGLNLLITGKAISASGDSLFYNYKFKKTSN